MQKVAQNVYVETGFRGCNVSFVATSDGVVMIDTPQVPADALKWRDEISKYGPIRYVINNEPHSDHISGNCFFGGILISHESSRPAIQQFSVKMVEEALKRIAPEALPLPEGYHIRTPDITLSERLTIYLGKHTFQLFHLPGHTPSELAVYIPEERVVCTSDNVVTGGQPFLHQAVPYEWLESLEKIQKFDADIIVPGHGEICDPSYIPQMKNVLNTWINLINDAINKGWSVEEAQDRIKIQDYFPEAPDNEFLKPMRRMFIANLYEKLKKK